MDFPSVFFFFFLVIEFFYFFLFLCNFFFFFLIVKLNGSRKVTGVLRGFDPFLNIVLDDAVEEVSATERHNIGMIVRCFFFFPLQEVLTSPFAPPQLGHSWKQHYDAGVSRESVTEAVFPQQQYGLGFFNYF